VDVTQQVRSADRGPQGLPPRPHLPLAEGIIMGLNRCSPEEAFGQLRDVSRRHGIGVRVLASALVQAAMSGEAPRTAEEHARAEVLALYWPLPMPGSRTTGEDGAGRLPSQGGHRSRVQQVVDLRHAD
jgi:ANTAR domain